MLKITHVAAAALLLCGTALHAADRQIVAPGASWVDNEAPSNAILFSPTSSTRLQLGFDRSLFGSEVMLVKEIAFRFDMIVDQNQSRFVPYDFGRTVIRGATIADIGSMTGVFEDNLANRAATLMDRDLAFVASKPGPANGPRGFSLLFTFDAPYLYNPNAGDLVIDIATSRGSSFMTVDYIRSGTDAIRTVFAGSGAATVGAGNMSLVGGPVSRITVAAVPEPASWALMIAGFAAVGAAARRPAASAKAVLS